MTASGMSTERRREAAAAGLKRFDCFARLRLIRDTVAIEDGCPIFAVRTIATRNIDLALKDWPAASFS
jgi:hypothetical protein